MILYHSNGAVITGLKQRFNEATRRKDVKAIVLTGEFLSSVFFYIH